MNLKSRKIINITKIKSFGFGIIIYNNTSGRFKPDFKNGFWAIDVHFGYFCLSIWPKW